MDTNNERGKERRRFVRYLLKARADIVIDNQLSEHGDVHDISTGGILLNLETQKLRKHLDKQIHAHIYADALAGGVTIEAGCSIVRFTSDGVALFFSSIDSTNRKILHDLIGELNNLVRDSRK